jgi:lysophospholipase L1-like esterase
LANFFDTSVSVHNSAVGGRSVRTWLYNVKTEMGTDGECLLEMGGDGMPTLQSRWSDMLKSMKTGDTLLIQFGINDGSATCDRHVGIAAFKSSYEMMAKAAIERGAEPVFITPVSSISCSGSTARGTRGEYVDATIDVGKALGVKVLDLHARSVARYTELKFCPVPGGDVSETTTGPVGDFFCDDHTHFSTSGAQEIAALVVELMGKVGVKVTSRVKP